VHYLAVQRNRIIQDDLNAEVIMNKKQPSSLKSDRRNFLKGVVVVSGATALSSVSAGLITESNPREKLELAKAQPSKGYHETPHIQAYYQTLRDS